MFMDSKDSFLVTLDVYQDDTSAKDKLEITLQLAELCIELIQQNEEHHAEVYILTFVLTRGSVCIVLLKIMQGIESSLLFQ